MKRKTKCVISDLHLGAGGFEKGNLLEDFHSDDAFARFLGQLAGESEQQRAEMELIVAGDMFEFLQVPSLPPHEYDPSASYPVELYASATEADSSRKMELIVAGHPRFFAALREFVRSSHPRRTVTIIKGNHDVNLHWLAVQDTVRAAIGATDRRASCLTFEERRVSREGIYVEHGHQYCERVSRFPDFEEPHDPHSPEQLYLPIGSRFVFTLFNDLERQLYWVDGVKPLTALIWYAFALDTRMAVRALWTLLRQVRALARATFPLGLTGEADLQAHGSLLTAPPHLRAALPHLRAALPRLREELGDAQAHQSLPRNRRRSDAFYRQLDAAMSYLGAPGSREQGLKAWTPRRIALSRGWTEERLQRLALARVAQHRCLQEKARVIVFGHSHEAGVGELEGGAVYINSGTWTWRRDFSGDDYAAWERLLRHPERHASERCLSYVRIDYTEDGTPIAHLREFRYPDYRKRSELL